MRNLIVMFVTAVCFLLKLKLTWPKNKNFYDWFFLRPFFSRSLFKRKSDYSTDRAHCVLNKDLHWSDRTSSNKPTTDNKFFMQIFYFHSQREMCTSGSIHMHDQVRSNFNQAVEIMLVLQGIDYFPKQHNQNKFEIWCLYGQCAD